MPKGRRPQLTVTLPCPACGPVVVTESEITLVCVGDVVRDVSYTCPGCRTGRELAAGPESLSLLHQAGLRVEFRPDSGPGRDDDDLDPARQVVSLRVLLDEPDFLARLASAERTPASRDEAIPQTPPVEAG